jgi:hypothetical protein
MYKLIAISLLVYLFIGNKTDIIKKNTPEMVSWSEVAIFLEQDNTNLISYGNGFYCSDFANTLIENAREQGIVAWRVDILFTHTIGHIIVAFQTTDNGIIYVEPQDDKPYFTVEVGQKICNINWCVSEEPIRQLIIHN